MKHLSIYSVLTLALMLIFSCEKGEKPVDPVPTRETVEIEIGFPYNNQVFYNCANNTIVSTIKKDTWDLAFDCSEEGFLIRINVSKGMLAANSGSTDFEGVTSTSGVTWKWDRADGDPAHTAIGEWLESGGSEKTSSNKVYIVNRQKNIADVSLGFKKIVFTGFSDNKYQFKFANLDGSDEHTFEIEKDPEYNYVYFSFDDGGKQVSVEPKKDEWDLLFTNYQHKFDNLPLPFVITGVLINRDGGTEAAKDSTVNYNFDDIALIDVPFFNFKKDRDVIGYDWKIIDRTDDSFTIDTRFLFVVKSINGKYYKLRFTDFYNDLGAKGYPNFEIERLQ